MLRIDSKNMNFNGSSIINNESFVSFNASVNEPDNNGYVSINISDMARLRSNLASVKADIAAFIDEIVKLPAAEPEDD